MTFAESQTPEYFMNSSLVAYHNDRKHKNHGNSTGPCKDMRNIDLDEVAEKKFGAYLRFCHVQGLHLGDELVFIIELLQANVNISKGVLKEGILEMQRQLQGECPSDNMATSQISIGGIKIPAMHERVKSSFCNL